jgi:hypothetical protein
MGFCSEVLQENINTVRLNANINLIIIESFPVNYEENLRVWYGIKKETIDCYLNYIFIIILFFTLFKHYKCQVYIYMNL